ncbi:MAG TPA: hypothetical protein VIK55_06445 [Paludibacter sp.]
MKPENKQLLKYIGILVVAIFVLLLAMSGESIIDNLLKPLK